jgi:flagellar L-ring protein precursor FlgH
VRRALWAWGLAWAALVLAGCKTVYSVPEVDFATATAPALPASGPVAIPEQVPLPQAVMAGAQANGAIFQAERYRPVFEDYRARMVGDTLTVNIVENVTASQSANSTVNKTGKVDSAMSAIAGLNATTLGKLGVTGASNNAFEGKGTTNSSNTFAGTITALVVGVLPNGVLMIAGEKQVGVNHRVDVLRFTGQVDPRAILPGNTVPSASIANVRIENRGRGALDDAQGIGPLSRFFLNILPI